jgi:AraC family ethanolamine operon transcriptional activator
LKRNAILSREAAEFWKRSIIDIMTSAALLGREADSDGHLLPNQKIVGNVEDYLDQAGSKPIHISELCGALNVSRRTLHRAFHDVLGIGPVTFLQRKRLCDIHSVLRAGNPATTSIAEVALQHGFLNVGRFSGYYRALFDEYPSETFGRTYAAVRPPQSSHFMRA